MTPNGFPEGRQDCGAAAPLSMIRRGQAHDPQRISLAGSGPDRCRGQATTEVVLLLPVFMFFLYAFAKVFALLILIQKMEIASYYAARRWQLESHRNVNYGGDDDKLQRDIQDRVSDYLGYNDRSVAGFLDLSGSGASLNISRTQVWQVVTLTVNTKPVNLPYYKSNAQFDSNGNMTSGPKGFKFEVTKYVPNRDRPIAFVLPGLQ